MALSKWMSKGKIKVGGADTRQKELLQVSSHKMSYKPNVACNWLNFRYYVCSWGKKIRMDCPASLKFNPILKVCDWPNQVKCGDDNQRNATTYRNGCPKSDKQIFIPDEYYCCKFHSCYGGVKTDFECPKGLQFNYKEQVCDWPHNVRCTDKAPPKRRICPLGVELNVQLPHEQFCNKYYLCTNGIASVRTCLPGLWFNPNIHRCHPNGKQFCRKNNSGKDSDLSLYS